MIITTHSIFSEAFSAESIRVLLPPPPPNKRFLAIFNLTSKAERGGRALGTEGEKWLFVRESLRSLETIPLPLSKGV